MRTRFKSYSDPAATMPADGPRDPAPHMASTSTAPGPNNNSTPPYTSLDFYMKMPGMVRSAVPSLKIDGSNFLAWKRRLFNATDFVTNVKNYLLTPRPASEAHWDSVIRAMIDLSIADNLAAQLNEDLSAKDTFEQIQAMFHFPSRTTHVGLWDNMIEARVEHGDSVNEHTTLIKSKIEDLDRMGFEWSKDSIQGIMLQVGLPKTGKQSFKNVNVILDARLRSLPQIKITSREAEEAIRAETHRLSSGNNNALPDISAISLNGRHAPPSNHTFGHSSQPAYRIPARQPHPHQKTPPVNRRPHQPKSGVAPAHLRFLYCCGGEGHWASACPLKDSRGPARPSNQPAVRVHMTEQDDQPEGGDGPLPDSFFTSEGALTEDWQEEFALADTGATHNVTNEERAN